MLKILTSSIVLLAAGYYYYDRANNLARVREPQELNETYDYIIAGGGTAGCVLAARLSEDPSVSVLLLEAGGEETDFWFSHIPGFVAQLQLTDFDWMYLMEPQKHCCSALQNRQGRWPRGKGLGGCSTHNYMNYVRCSPKDYDHWANDLNATGWSYKEILPYFKKIETYQIDHLQGRTEHHGYDGPLTVNEGFRTPIGESFQKALQRQGYPFLDDTNGENFEGFSWVQFNINGRGKRMSTASAYLRPAMARPNLHVAVKTHVSKVKIERKNPNSLVATGVEYFHNGQHFQVKAKREVIVAGGAINSPQILMLSGIGARKQLEQFSIPVLLDNPAVGSNLNDHIAVVLMYKTNESGLVDGHTINTWPGFLKIMAKYFVLGQGTLSKTPTEITGFFRTGLLPSPLPDIQLYVFSLFPFPDAVVNLSPEAIKRRTAAGEELSFAIGAVNLHPSDLGQIRLKSADPFAHPIIDHHYFKSSVDIDVMVKGLRMLVDVTAKSPELKALDVQFAEGPVPGCEAHKPLSDEYLKCSIRNRAVTLYHPVGTCRMGPKGENSVIDNELRVHGVDGLRVVDASSFPDQVSGNTHVPTIMLAEKASDWIKRAKRP